MDLNPYVPEILAPAGGREQFFAALHAGADAVFLGLTAFNARARAQNFTPDDLRELVPLAHHFGMKVLVTVNILVKETELESLIQTLALLEALEVDAIIVQDIAVVRLVRAAFPTLRLHASTQMAVHNLAGVRAAQDLGLKRVVLAREMTAVELRRIRQAIPREEIELEVFCHGSLCYSYSGLCFFSGAEDARSGNRGECAYTCRQPYTIKDPANDAKTTGFLFSMRDLDTSNQLDLLIKAGVDTLKIEGRKKDAQYVATTVRLYRSKLDALFGRSTLRPEAPKTAHGPLDTAAIEQDLRLTFSRRPTSFFLAGRYKENVIDLDNPTHQGLPLGPVRSVRGHTIRVRLEADVERFDGIRLIPPGGLNHQNRYDNAHVEFSLRDLHLAGRQVFAAPRGTEVEITLPKDAPTPLVGSALFKTRSAALKQRIGQWTVPPHDYKLRPLSPIAISIEITRNEATQLLSLTVSAYKKGDLLRSVSLEIPETTARGTSTLLEDLNDTFAILGNVGFAATSLDFSGDPQWFVPRSRLKKLRQELESGLVPAYADWTARRIARALEILNQTSFNQKTEPKLASSSPGLVASPSPAYIVKCDRMEILDWVLALAASRTDFPLCELIYEPKRSLLTDLTPATLAETLAQKAAKAGVPLRIALPTVIRTWDEPLLARWMDALRTQGFTRFEVGNLGGLPLLRGWGFDLDSLDIAGDFTLYSLNSASYRAWREMGLSQVCLSVEDDRNNVSAQLARLTPEERSKVTAILYKDVPLFLAEACSLTALHGGCPTAQVCGYRPLTIQNPKGETFHVAHETCKSVVYGEEAYALSQYRGELQAMGVQRFRLDFLTRPYTSETIHAILSEVMGDRPLPKTHSANWTRALL